MRVQRLQGRIMLVQQCTVLFVFNCCHYTMKGEDVKFVYRGRRSIGNARFKGLDLDSCFGEFIYLRDITIQNMSEK